MDEAMTEPDLACWDDLPEVSLSRVFWWLGDRDRAQAARVCRKWYQVMHSPCLWRHRTFTFCERRSRTRRSEFESAIWYARKFGKYLEHLEIRFLNPYSAVLTRKFQLTMRTFLSCIGKDNNRLRSLIIPHLELDRVVWKHNIRNALLRSLNFFLRREGKHLEFLNVKGAKLSTEQGCAVLTALCHQKNSSSLTELNIEDFFSHHLAVHANPLFAQTISKFQKLSVLSLNYNCISDEVLDILSENCFHTLLTMNIKCHVNDPHGQVVWGMSWSKLAKHAPNLKVNFSFERVMRHDHLTRILSREIPLRSLSLRSCYFSDPEWALKPTLTELIPTYKYTLQKLIIEFNNGQEPLDTELLQLVLVCDKLYYLKIWAFFEVRFIEELLQHKLEGKSNVRILKARIYTHKYETSDEDKLLRDVYRKYKDLIDKEMSYFVITYPMM